MITQEIQETRAAWDTIAAGYDRFVTPSHMWLAGEALRRAGLRPGMRVLDVAAGSGALSIPAARLGAHVLAVDLSPGMLARLADRARREGLAVETRVMDGHALDLEDARFDVAGSQYGVMLFPDMPRGIRELARVTRPEGRVLLNAYGPPQQIDFFQFFLRAIQTAVPGFTGPPADQPLLPFQLQDPARLRQELGDAGLTQIEVMTVTETLEFESGAVLWEWLTNSNPVAGQVLAGLKLDARRTRSLREALDGLLAARARERGAGVLTNPVHIGLGTKPPAQA